MSVSKRQASVLLAKNNNPRLYSPLGDVREHPCPCKVCRRETYNYSATCDACLDKRERKLAESGE